MFDRVRDVRFFMGERCMFDCMRYACFCMEERCMFVCEMHGREMYVCT